MADTSGKQLRQVPYSLEVTIPSVTIESALQMDLPRQVKNNVIRGLIERVMARRPDNVMQWGDGWADTWGDTWGDTWSDVLWDNSWSDVIA
jgi:hypothetical protein